MTRQEADRIISVWPKQTAVCSVAPSGFSQAPRDLPESNVNPVIVSCWMFSVGKFFPSQEFYLLSVFASFEGSGHKLNVTISIIKIPDWLP